MHDNVPLILSLTILVKINYIKTNKSKTDVPKGTRINLSYLNQN